MKRSNKPWEAFVRGGLACSLALSGTAQAETSWLWSALHPQPRESFLLGNRNSKFFSLYPRLLDNDQLEAEPERAPSQEEAPVELEAGPALSLETTHNEIVKTLSEQDQQAHEKARALGSQTRVGIYRGQGPNGSICTAIVRDSSKMYFKEAQPSFELTLFQGTPTDPNAGLKNGDYVTMSFGHSPELGALGDDIPAAPTAGALHKFSDEGNTLPLPVVRKDEGNPDQGAVKLVVDRLAYRFEDQPTSSGKKTQFPTRQLKNHALVRKTHSEDPLQLREMRDELNMKYYPDSSTIKEISVESKIASASHFSRNSYVAKDAGTFLKKEEYARWQNLQPPSSDFSTQKAMTCKNLSFVSPLPRVWTQGPQQENPTPAQGNTDHPAQNNPHIFHSATPIDGRI